MTIARQPIIAIPSRRRFLWNLGGGIAGLALCDLLGRENLLGNSEETNLPSSAQETAFFTQS